MLNISNHTNINCLCGLVEDAELAVVPLVAVDLKQGFKLIQSMH